MKTIHKLLPFLFFCLLGNMVSAQEITVQGTVTDQNGEPLIGASVQLKEAALGVVTEVDGSYSINVPAEGILVFSYVGFRSAEVPIRKRAIIDIRLEIETLEEVVVVGYGTQKKSDLTGSVARVTPEDLAETSAASMETLIQGRLPGVQVNVNSGEPGVGATIRIRGISSLAAGNDPLLVIDGFPIGGAGNLKQVNPADIESIEVLKDASAAAIYGARGANGVIIVTTKRGKENSKGTISLSTQTSLQRLSNNIEVLDALQTAILSNEGRRNAGLTEAFVGAPDAFGVYHPSIEEIESGAWPHNTYWPDVTGRDDAMVHNYALTARGGTDRNQYAFSGSYFRQEGILISNVYERITGRLNVDQQVKSWFKLGANLAASFIKDDKTSTWLERSAVWPVYNDDGSYFTAGPFDFNPKATADNFFREDHNFDLIATLFADLQITPWLSFRSSLGSKYGNAIGDVFLNEFTFGGPELGRGEVHNWTGLKLTNQNYFTLKKDIREKHQVNATLGFTVEDEWWRTSSLIGEEFVNLNLQNQNLFTADMQTTRNGRGSETIMSFIGRINYIFDDKYLLTFTSRADGSSKFGPNNKWGFFPSVALGWKLHREKFMENLGFISTAKLRASYGIIGNQGIPGLTSVARLGTSKYYFGDGNLFTGFGSGDQIPNPNIKWETTTTFNAGIDLGILEDRIQATLDVYQKKTTGLLRAKAPPPSTGKTSFWDNDGAFTNTGIEIGLIATVYNKGALRWDMNVNFTRNLNEVTELKGLEAAQLFGPDFEAYRSPIALLAVGQPYAVFYGYEVDGIIQNVTDVSELIYANGVPDEPGEFKFVDQNGDGTIDIHDRTIIGNPHPDFFFGINNTISWKGFDLSIFLQGSYGNDVWNTRKWDAGEQLARWTPDNPTNERPSMRANRFWTANSWFIEDGSYLRIQNAALGYTFDVRNISWLGSARIYVNATNLYTFTGYSGFDPETNSFPGWVIGVDNSAYPRVRTFTLGTDISF